MRDGVQDGTGWGRVREAVGKGIGRSQGWDKGWSEGWGRVRDDGNTLIRAEYAGVFRVKTDVLDHVQGHRQFAPEVRTPYELYVTLTDTKPRRRGRRREREEMREGGEMRRGRNE